jgi:hydroxyacylglutathione hydrolase
MIHEILPVGLLQCNCSILGDEASREAIVVDPGDEIGRIQEVLDRHGLKVTAIVITHAHIDHIGGAAKLKAATGAPVYMNADDQELYDHMDIQAQWIGMKTPAKTEVDVELKDDMRLKLGDMELTLLHTPGHTQGSSCVWIPGQKVLLAGDTLFRDSVGRTDLPGGDHHQLIHSIRDKLLVLPGEAVVIPGHGGATTIEREKERNPFLRGV